MGKFDQKVIFITGASAGIGAALAREFHRQGAHLVLTARREERLKEIKDQLGVGKQRILYDKCDVNDEASLKNVVQKACNEFGSLDVVVANAGFGVVGNVEDLSIDDFKRQLETNVYGVIKTIQATLRHLKRSKGRAVIIGSVSGYVSLPGNAPYSMSKFAVRALADSLYYELASEGVSVTHIAPGFVVSEIRQVDNQGTFHPEHKEKLSKFILMPTQKAAKQIVRATYQRKRERVITCHGKLLVWIYRHIPWLLSFLIKKMNVSGRAQPNH